jgi:hypothetical protein
MLLGIGYKKALSVFRKGFFAEEEGFEPPVPHGTTVFKTAAIDHSATPLDRVDWSSSLQK